MASKAIAGKGTKFQRSDQHSSHGSYSNIAEINNITGPKMKRNTIDVTSLDSTGGYEEFIPGFRDGGEVTLAMNFNVNGYIDMKTDFESDVLGLYRIIFPDTNQTTFDFSGFVTDLGVGIPTKDKITADITIKISGPVTVTS
jgi:predicted secreted protein